MRFLFGVYIIYHSEYLLCGILRCVFLCDKFKKSISSFFKFFPMYNSPFKPAIHFIR